MVRDGRFIYVHLLAQHLESEAAKGRTINFAGFNSLPAGLGDVYRVNFERLFPGGKADSTWAMAKPPVELIVTAMEPITLTMAAGLLGWTAEAQERTLEATALLLPVRDDKFHVFHKTVVDWLTGEIADGSSVKVRSTEFQVERDNGHAVLARGFVAWLGTLADQWAESDAPKPKDAVTAYWLQHGVVHLCRAGQAARAAEVYSSDLALLQRRLYAGFLANVAKDFLELSRTGVNLTAPTQMKSFVGKFRDVLQREGGAAVAQLASQQPDESVVFEASKKLPPSRTLKWCNKPQKADPCMATLPHPSAVNTLAVSETRIVSGAGKVVYV